MATIFYSVEVWHATGHGWVSVRTTPDLAVAEREARGYLGGDARGIRITIVLPKQFGPVNVVKTLREVKS
jgi:transglutaminase-like putative cysteine protease